MHSWFIRKWAAWCAGYRHACCSPARLCTSLAHHILMGCLSQLLITSHPSLYFDGESGKGVFRQSLLHLFFGPLLPLLLFVPSFWFWRGLWLADCCFWLPSDSYSAASVMSADTAPGLVAMPSSEEEEGLSAWSVMRRGNGSDSLLGLVLILLFLNCSGSQYCNSVREGYPRGGENKIHRTTRTRFDSDYLHNESGPFFCVSKSRGAVEQLACIPGALLQLMGAVCCAVSSNTCTRSDFCVSSHSFRDDFSYFYQPREVSWPSGAFFPAFWAQTWVHTGCGNRHHQSFMSACHRSLHLMHWRKLL